MFKYLKDRNKKALLEKLLEVQNYCNIKYGNLLGEKSLWFKFGEDDTLSTTIDEIDVLLSLPKTHINNAYILEQFELVTNDIDPKNELIVYYS